MPAPQIVHLTSHHETVDALRECAGTGPVLVLPPGAAWRDEWNEQLQASAACTIFPAHPLVRQQWEVLPKPVAALLTAPWNGAAVVIASEVLQQASGEMSLWELLALHIGSDLAVGSLTRDVTLPVICPELAPPPVEIPRWLSRACCQFAESPRASLHQRAITAGLLLAHDQLDASHRISQEMEGDGADHPGDYWHAIMHRREPDYGNSKYWFRHVGTHPVFPQLATAVQALAQGNADAQVQAWATRLVAQGQWRPAAFVDLCEATADDSHTPLARFAQQVQWLEITLLLAQQAAVAGV